jgi:hypothetical protein
MAACCHPSCKVDHLLDPALAWIYALAPTQISEMYADAVRQNHDSMLDDLKAGRSASFFMRVRLTAECYMRGLWVSLIASPKEIIHDASGEPPHLSLEKVTNIVFSHLIDSRKPVKTFALPSGKNFEVNDLLHVHAHSTAYVLPFAYFVKETNLQKFTTHFRDCAGTLRRVSRRLKEGKSRKHVITELRNAFSEQARQSGAGKS